MLTLYEWALRWRIPEAAMQELRIKLGIVSSGYPTPDTVLSEAGIQSIIKLEASRKGARLWRNNVGAGVLDTGSYVRFGLGNESTAVNKVFKSADLIGIRPVAVTPSMVGATIGQFVSREVKHSGWRFNPNNEREAAQLNWALLVMALGGDACFANSEGTL